MLITILLTTLAFALPEPIILPSGPGYLGILVPKKQGDTDRFDAVLIEPRTGKLWLEHSDDNQESRIYRGEQWELSDRAAYEYKDNQLSGVTDIWGIKVQYEYKKNRLVAVRWPSGREIRISYDEQERVKKLADSAGEVLSVHWWNEERATVTDQLGYSIQWTLKSDSIWVKDSIGHSAHGFYENDLLVGWEDPRGQQTQIVRKGNQIYLKDSFSRTWTIAHEEKRLSFLSISGVGNWSWKRNDRGEIVEIVDPSMKKLEIDRNSLGRARLYRAGVPVDFSYDSNNRLKEIADSFGELLRIKRDSFGQIEAIEDALGGTITFRRGKGGRLQKMTLRNGQEWNFEYDAMQNLRHMISPNQEVIAFSRDLIGNIIAIDYAQQQKIKLYRDIRGNIRKIEDSVRNAEGGQRDFRLDAFGRVIFDSAQNIKINYDSLGNISTISQEQKVWKITRDGQGQISRWDKVSFGRNAAGLIISIQEPTDKWNILRDATGRIESIGRSDKLVSVEYDALGYPKVWREGQKNIAVTRNEYGWITEEGEVKIKRDRRGWIKENQYGDSSWEWRRDGSGFALQAFLGKNLQKQMRLGLERDDSGQLVALKFPNGAYQRWALREEKLMEKLVGVEGQVLEQNQYILTSNGWGSSAQQVFQDSTPAANLYEYDTVGLRVRENKDDLQIFDYDPFGRLTQVCEVDGCHHFFYDPLGRLAGYQDAQGFPIVLLWGRDGIENEQGAFEMVPLLHGGEFWLHSPFGNGLLWGFNGFAEGSIFSLQGHRNWLIRGENILSRSSVIEQDKTMLFQQKQLLHEELKLSFFNGLAWDEAEKKYLQAGIFWQADSKEAQLFNMASQISIWNDPIQMLFQMKILEPDNEWSSIETEPEFFWLNPVLQEYLDVSMPTIQSFPFQENGLEQYMIEQLIKGNTDPSSTAIVQFIVEQEISDVPNFFRKDINKCVGSLAFFFQCGY